MLQEVENLNTLYKNSLFYHIMKSLREEVYNELTRGVTDDMTVGDVSAILIDNTMRYLVEHNYPESQKDSIIESFEECDMENIPYVFEILVLTIIK